MGDQLAVRPGKIGGRGHRGKVVPPGGRVDGGTGELAVDELFSTALKVLVHPGDVVGPDLMSQTTRPRVEHHDHLLLLQSQFQRLLGKEDPVHGLHLEEVIAGAERAELPQSPFLGMRAHLRRVRRGKGSHFLFPRSVLGPALSLVDRPLTAAPHHLLDARAIETDGTLAPHSARNIAEELLHQRSQFRTHLGRGQIRGDEPHPTVDVVTDPSRGDHSLVQVEGRHPADRETVPEVNVRHRQRGPHDAR